MKNPSSCSDIQELIAWGKPLEVGAKEHIADCAACCQIALEFAELDSLVANAPQTLVPDDFAERVMAEIAALESPRAVTRPADGRTFGRRSLSWAELRPVQLGLVSVTFLVTLTNLVWYVLAVLIPEVA